MAKIDHVMFWKLIYIRLTSVIDFHKNFMIRQFVSPDTYAIIKIKIFFIRQYDIFNTPTTYQKSNKQNLQNIH